MTLAPEDARLRAAKVRLAVFDVDGVLTDGRLFMDGAGEEIKAFHTLDGHGLKMLRATGVKTAIISGRSSRAVELRAKNLGFDFVHQGIEDKVACCASISGPLGLSLEQIAYIGDDVVDLPLLLRAGFSASVPNAPALVLSKVHLITVAEGGAGAVRELCEFIMAAQGTLEAALAQYLR